MLTLAFLARNPILAVGIVLVLCVLAFAYVGPLFVDLTNAGVASAFPGQSPNAEHWLGTQAEGRDMLAWLMRSTRNSLRWALTAAGAGTVLGVGLGFVRGRVGRFVQRAVEIASGNKTTILGLFTLVSVLLLISAVELDLSMEYRLILVVLAAASSMGPARIVRFLWSSTSEHLYADNEAQSSTKSANVSATKQNRSENLGLLLIAAIAAIATSIAGLACMEALGFGPDQYHGTLTSIQFWAHFYNAILRGMWWWWAPPIVVSVILFVGAIAVSFGIDRWVKQTTEQHVSSVENND